MDHAFVVADGHVFQSYAFQHPVESRPYDAARPYWQHVSCDADAYKNHTLLFWTPIV